jgi:hypothetical protein
MAINNEILPHLTPPPANIAPGGNLPMAYNEPDTATPDIDPAPAQPDLLQSYLEIEPISDEAKQYTQLGRRALGDKIAGLNTSGVMNHVNWGLSTLPGPVASGLQVLALAARGYGVYRIVRQTTEYGLAKSICATGWRLFMYKPEAGPPKPLKQALRTLRHEGRGA